MSKIIPITLGNDAQKNKLCTKTEALSQILNI